MGSRREGAWLPVVGSYWGDDTTDFGFCQLLAATSFTAGLSNALAA